MLPLKSETIMADSLLLKSSLRQHRIIRLVFNLLSSRCHGFLQGSLLLWLAYLELNDHRIQLAHLSGNQHIQVQCLSKTAGPQPPALPVVWSPLQGSVAFPPKGGLTNHVLLVTGSRKSVLYTLLMASPTSLPNSPIITFLRYFGTLFIATCVHDSP